MAALLPGLCGAPEVSVRLEALLRAYGTGRSFFNVWVQNNFASALFRLEDSFFLLDLGAADFEEAAFFLNFNPYFRRLSGELRTLERITPHLSPHTPIERTNLLRYSTGLQRPVDFGHSGTALKLLREPELKSVYTLMAQVLPQVSDYVAWYADLSHRIRHGCARAYLLCEGNLPVSACVVSAESDRAGLISGVSTLGASRGCGYASQMLAGVCDDLLKSRKLPVLECLDPLLPFYGRLGFRPAGAMGELETGRG